MIHQSAKAIFFENIRCRRSSSPKASTHVDYDENIMPVSSFLAYSLCFCSLLISLCISSVHAQKSSQTQELNNAKEPTSSEQGTQSNKTKKTPTQKSGKV